MKSIKAILNSKHRTNKNKQKTKKSLKDEKTSFPKEYVGNADLDKSIMNKIMASRNERIKYNFGVPLRTSISKRSFFSI